MNKINFLEETIRCLNQNGKTEEDVLWVGRGVLCAGRGIGRYIFSDMPEGYKTTWEDFRSKADFSYDCGYGLECIPTDLIIVGKDFWLERGIYDGLEWWEFRTMPKEPALTRELDLSDVYEELERKERLHREVRAKKENRGSMPSSDEYGDYSTEYEDFWEEDGDTLDE